MAKTKKTSALQDHGSKKAGIPTIEPVPPAQLDQLEFHRHAVALMPAPTDRFPAIAYCVEPAPGISGQRFCTCRSSKSATCDHLKQLSRALKAFQGQLADEEPAKVFKAGFWHQLAVLMAENGALSLVKTQLMGTDPQARQGPLVVQAGADQPKLVYVSGAADRQRLIERCTFSNGSGLVPTRADVLNRLSMLTISDTEQVLAHKGMKTVRQTLEESFWYRFGYHCFREFGQHRLQLHPFIDEANGDFQLQGKDASGALFFYLTVPRKKVKRVLKELAGALSNSDGLSIQPLSLDAVFDVTLNEALELEIRPLHRMIQKNGELQFFKRDDIEKYQYGDLFYIKELGMLVEDHYPAPRPAYVDPVHTLIRKSRVPHFLAEHGAELRQPLFILDEAVQKLKIIDSFDRMEITPEAIEREWCWLSIIYGDGDQSVSLTDIVQAKLAGENYVATPGGWVDCQAPVFDPLDELLGGAGDGTLFGQGHSLRMSRADVYRLGLVDRHQVHLVGQGAKKELLERLLDLRPAVCLPQLTGFTSVLRPYQQRGVEWLWFLYENHFGGLLCDDMGLGKTHQLMAFMVALRELGTVKDPFLVVCPTSVISHWQQKIADHAPGLRAAVYYGGERDLAQTRAGADVLVTSYGVLLRDIQALSQMAFDLVAFDEIQQIKNAKTKSYSAALSLRAEMKIGLTGTPIENSLSELKSLMDVTVPGYLGADEAFDDRFRIPIEEHNHPERRRALGRLISPFTLRRMKKSVLNELPEKIEDIRSCCLSEEQVKLYRDAIESRGRDLLDDLEDQATAVPYIHIFALLTLLKQICNHPALAAKDEAAYPDYASGKWDLFTEILSEALDSDQKIVVYSQYLGMIDIIQHYLTDRQVAHVRLTGASSNRGQIIRRFQEDPLCRVFVGSLKAGGVGIDLVAASVVIHYDRWWNAAREDQATDRVHRIGQTRGVQVFKLITQGTLEEKISAIIAKKKDLMDSVVQEDDPALVKSFSRSELIEMLAMP